MAPQIFMTGASGYVGSQLLHDMVAKHPDWHVTGLVRTEEQAKKINSKHPSVHMVIGDLDSSDIIIEQSKQANVVIRILPKPTPLEIED
jgi:N-acetyl-gamma-glutamylphosphate reductase